MKHIKNIFKTLIACAVCTGLASCSLFSSGKQKIMVQTNDPAAVIRSEGQYVGTGSGVVTLKKNRGHIITAENGSKKGMALVESEISVTGVLDIIGGCCFLLPFLGFVSKGAWTLNPDSVYIEVH